MQTKIQKWGNSLAVRIPKPFVQEIHMGDGTLVDLSMADGKMVITPTQGMKLSLQTLLKNVTKKNIHTVTDFGTPVGKEVW